MAHNFWATGGGGEIPALVRNSGQSPTSVPPGVVEDYTVHHDEVIPGGREKPPISTPSFPLTKQAQLFRNINYQAGYWQLNQFNHWLANTAKHVIEGHFLTVENRGTVTFRGPKILEPSLGGDVEPRPLMPQYCRENNLTYSSEWTVDLIFTPSDAPRVPSGTGPRIPIKGDLAEVRDVKIGKIPLMLKSQKCHLKDLDRGRDREQKLREVGEDPNDPYGFFIIEGQEKVVLSQEKLTTGRIFVMKIRDTVCRLTANTARGTALMELSTQGRALGKPVILIRLQTMSKAEEDKIYRTINVIMVYRHFGIRDSAVIRGLISRFIPRKWRARCLLEFLPTEINADEYETDGVYYRHAARSTMRELTDEQIKSQMEDVFRVDLFPHVHELAPLDGETSDERLQRVIDGKLDLHSMMIAHYLMNKAGYTDLVRRDGWDVKRVEGAARLMGALLSNAWNRVLGDVQASLIKGQRALTVKPAGEILEEVGKKITANPTITNTFEDSFRQAKWGVKGTKQKNNVTQPLGSGRESQIAAHAHVNTVDVAIVRKDKQLKLRLVDGSALGMLCAATTTEGPNCGLVKGLCISCGIAVWHKDTAVIDMLLREVTKDGSVRVDNSAQVPHDKTDVCMINGKFIGWCNGESLLTELKVMRRQQKIPSDVTLIYRRQNNSSDLEENMGYFYYDSGPSRLIRPLLIVDGDALVVEKKNLWDRDTATLLREGAMEYISPWEQESVKIAPTAVDIKKRSATIRRSAEEVKRYELKIQRLRQRTNESSHLESLESALSNARDNLREAEASKPYTHCEVDPQAILSVPIACTPYPEYNMAPRVTYQGNMSKQAMGLYHTDHSRRIDGKNKVLSFPQSPICATEHHDFMGLDSRGSGHTTRIAIQAVDNTEEDAFVLSKRAVDFGLFRSVKYFVVRARVDNSLGQKLTRPRAELQGKKAWRYKYISENGLPEIGAYLSNRECAIGMVQTNGGVTTNISTLLKVGDEGVVTRIFVIGANQSNPTVIVKFRTTRIPQASDKQAPRNAQKGTDGKIVPDNMLAWSVLTGMTADVTINTSQIPSRMTVSYLIEILGSKAAAMLGVRVNGSPFRGFDLPIYRQALRDSGMDEYGRERYRSALTGELLETPIFTGLVQFQCLKHQGSDKMQARPDGPVRESDHQPPKGRAQGGGIRFGEMERDAAICHGATALLIERLCTASDAYLVIVCVSCGEFAVENFNEKIYSCPYCGSDITQPIGVLPEGKSKFGKLIIPYSLKYIQQILAGASIRMGLNVGYGAPPKDVAAMSDDIGDRAIEYMGAIDDNEEEDQLKALIDREEADRDLDTLYGE